LLDRSKESLLGVTSLLYQLQHPQLPRFWATFEENDRLFLVRDYIRGLTYAELLEDRRNQGTQFTEGEVRKFLGQMLPVLAYIHSKGFIHQDICPQNIILRDDPNLELLPVPIDFGAIEEASRRFTQSDGELPPIGTPGYIAPERLDRGSSSPSSDLYSLAATAVVLLSGKEATDLCDERGEWDYDWRRWIPVSDDLMAVLMQMLEREPQDRYPAATDVLVDLSRHQKLERSSLRGTLSESSIPTIDVNSSFHSEPVSKNRVYTSLTNLRVKSIWENPAIFIPLGLLVSIVAGFGAWFGVSQILQRQKTATAPATPTVAIAPSQGSSSPAPASDFQNPTVESSAATTGESIQLATGQAISRDGTVDSGSTVKYRLQATTGQTVDIATGSTQVLMTIFDSTGIPVSRGERVSSWRGELATGEYNIELRPLQGLDGKGFPYKVAIAQSATIASPGTSTETTTIPGMGVPTTNSGIVPPMGQIDGNPNIGSGSGSATAVPIPVVPVSVPSERPQIPQTSIDRSTGTTTKTSETERPRRRVVRQQSETNTTSEETPRRRRRIVRQRSTEGTNTTEQTTQTSGEETPRRRRRVVRKQAEPAVPAAVPASKPADTAGESTEKLPEYKTPIAVPKPKNGAAPADSDGGSEGNGLDTE
jgi:serine/threonine protein kinase